ncbi:hypothetical protein MRB53_016613 [Persea americana]|uniref:Uncharacterized protein n=1 Tax=Persea americana TaxID=3435 RepID=A0ACC2M2U4_PERAE|nr:hypothetical protein MRB53_016613 [Persea americana]
MPQVDLETLLRVGSGRRVVCETLIDPEPDNSPAESFRLPADDEIDWVDRNAVLHRNESTKGGAIILNPINTSNSNSKRFKSKAHIIGLPKRPDSAQLRLSSRRRCCRPPNIRLFPKPAVTEPESPKVSCIGRIRSRKAKGSGRLGFWARFVAVFGCERKVSVEGAVSESESGSEKASSEKKVPAATCLVQAAEATAPGLGGMRKFSSGRRAESWEQVELDVHAA